MYHHSVSVSVPGMGIMPTLINRLSETKHLRPILLILNALCADAACVSSIAAVSNSLSAIQVFANFRQRKTTLNILLFSGVWRMTKLRRLLLKPSTALRTTTMAILPHRRCKMKGNSFSRCSKNLDSIASTNRAKRKLSRF